MFCQFCGSKMLDNAKYCPNCGKASEGEATTDKVITQPVTKKNIAMGVVALILGIVGFVFGALAVVLPYVGFVFAIPALVLGIIGIRKSKKGLAIAGVILAGITILSTAVGSIARYAITHNDEQGRIYRVVSDSYIPDDEMNDLVYKLQKRVENYTTLGSVHIKTDEDHQYIVINMPGIADEDEAYNSIIRQGKLEFYTSDGEVFLTGNDITDATAGTYDYGMGNVGYCVNLTFTEAGAQIFADVTGESIGKTLPIVLDGEVISAPMVQTMITGGVAQITNMETYEAAENLATCLRTGSLGYELEEVIEK